VAAAGELLRGFHDATGGSALAGEQETVCHRDAGPHNMLFGDDYLPYALIDLGPKDVWPSLR
jgi:Ser/Thr protein kinase RdoA (MazF antagonist)